MANLYYREDLSEEAFRPGARVDIVGDEARHAVRVSRLRVGERILVGNGAGIVGAGEVLVAERDACSVQIDEIRREPLHEPRLVLVQALAKGDRDERAVEQATEFGVDRIVPWQAERSVSRWQGSAGPGSGGGGEKAARGAAKWRRVAREASKQSLRARIPEVADAVTSLPALIELRRRDTAMLVLDPRGGSRLGEWAAAPALPAGTAGAPAEILLVVGPEGGLGETELRELRAAGAATVRLGETVLRTSSAGPAALAILNVALGRW